MSGLFITAIVLVIVVIVVLLLADERNNKRFSNRRFFSIFIVFFAASYFILQMRYDVLNPFYFALTIESLVSSAIFALLITLIIEAIDSRFDNDCNDVREECIRRRILVEDDDDCPDLEQDD